MTYYFILKFFFKISFVYILESLLISFHTFYITYKFDRVFDGKFSLAYYLYTLFCDLIIISYIKDASDLFLEKHLFLKNR